MKKNIVESPELFGKQSKHYHAGRPIYPESLFAALKKRCDSFYTALDCGAGTGQASLSLSQHFDTVVALDRSASQLSDLIPSKRIYRVLAYAECLPFPDSSFDLVSAAESAHWFKWDLFVKEAFRVLRDNGVFAVWCYYLPKVSPRLDQIIDELYNTTLAHYIDGRRRLIINKYTTLEIPNINFERVNLQTRMHWTFETMISNLRSSSVVNREIMETGLDPVDLIEKRLRKAWGTARQLEAVWDLSMLVCNRPVRRLP